MGDNRHVDCTTCREALSAQLDAEESAEERAAVDIHVTTCAACQWFADEAARVTRLARTAVTTPEPDITLELLTTFDGLVTVLQALTDLDRDSTICATAMMALNTADMVSATRAALDCADIAAAAQRVLSRPTATDAGVIRAVLEAVATAADRCAAECGQHAGHHGHCRAHSESAQRTAELCRAELQNITG
ncbi:MAG: zf-HC2 domain-containing protein [Pseudonocardiaceae bacterium]